MLGVNGTRVSAAEEITLRGTIDRVPKHITITYLCKTSLAEKGSEPPDCKRLHTLLSNIGRNRDCLSSCSACMAAWSSSTSTCVRASRSASRAVGCVSCAHKAHACLHPPSRLTPSTMHSINIMHMDLTRAGVAVICQEWQGLRSCAVNQQDRSSRFDHIVEVLPDFCSDNQVVM